MAFANVFKPKVIKYESQKNGATFVAPESWICGGFILAGFVKTDAEKIIFLFSGLRQAIASSESFEIYPSIAGVRGEVIFINELLQDI